MTPDTVTVISGIVLLVGIFLLGRRLRRPGQDSSDGDSDTADS